MKSPPATCAFRCLALILLIGCGSAQQITLGSKAYHIEIREDGEKLNWHAALNFCNSKGMQLLTIENQDERRALFVYMLYRDLPNRWYWTSINDLAEKDKWVSASTGQPVEFSNWLEGEPNNYRPPERCTQVWNKKLQLNDVRCELPGTDTICEKQILNNS